MCLRDLCRAELADHAEKEAGSIPPRDAAEDAAAAAGPGAENGGDAAQGRVLSGGAAGPAVAEPQQPPSPGLSAEEQVERWQTELRDRHR